MNNQHETALAEESYIAYVKGSCNPQTRAGGCAYSLRAPNSSDTSEGSRKSVDTTNNIAEMQAVIDALRNTPEGKAVQIRLNSEYIKHNFEKSLPDWIKNDWKKSKGKGVKNSEKWQEIQALTTGRNVTFHKLHADDGDPEYERVSQLAKKETRKAESAICRMAGGSRR